MTGIFVDTSALIALLDADDRHHDRARRTWKRVLESGDRLISTNYVLVEAFALAQSRMGPDLARVLEESFFPFLVVEWVDRATHAAGISAVLVAGRKKLSLVDCVSFEVMRRLAIRHIFCFDRHFREQGFTVL